MNPADRVCTAVMGGMSMRAVSRQELHMAVIDEVVLPEARFLRLLATAMLTEEPTEALQRIQERLREISPSVDAPGSS